MATTADTSAAPADVGEQRNNLTVAGLLLEYLKLEAATTIFGIPGGAAVWIIEEAQEAERDVRLRRLPPDRRRTWLTATRGPAVVSAWC